MYPIWLLEKFREHALKLGQTVLELIGGSLWERKHWGMEDSPLVFAIVPDQDGAFPHYFEAGTFMSDFIFPPSPGPCLWDDEELR